MFKTSEIKRIIEDCVKRGLSKFILYPFGDNGVLVRNLLRDYFNIRPEYIVDNKYCLYNSEIISFDELISKDIDHCTVILTAEDEELNILSEEMCLEHFDRTQIINLKQLTFYSTQILTWHYLQGEYCEKAFCASNFLKYIGKSDEVRKGEKIKVRVLHNGARVWNAFETVCSAFGDDSRFEVLLILYSMANDLAEMVEQAKTGGYKYIDRGQYDPVMDQPDIFIYASPFMKTYVKPICREAKISCIIPITLMLYSPNRTDRIACANKTVEEMEEAGVDYCLAESYLYNNLPQSSSVSILEFGNPKIDVLYRLSLKEKNSKRFSKLNDKRVILFATAHGNRNGRFIDGITFDLYAKQIFDFAAQNPEIGLIFRPHPLFIVELLESNYWQRGDIVNFKRYMDSTENMIWDDNDTYEDALMTADVIITDGYCGMVVSTLPLLKPICALYRNYEIQSMCPEVDEILYVARDKKELDVFLKKVVDGKEDSMFEIRKSAYNNFIKNFDGQNGKRIKEFITSKYFDF